MFAGKFEWGPSEGDNFNMTHPLFQFVAKLNNFRRLYPALQTGAQKILCSAADPGLFAYTRRLGAQEVLVVFNTANTNQILGPCPVIYPAGTKLKNLLANNEVLTIRPDGQTPPIVVPGASAKMFIALPQMRPLNPTVTEISPAHDSTGISPAAPIIIHFSVPMDAASTERAFSTEPSEKGTFTWSPGSDEMTFTPKNPAFKPQTMVIVRISDTARAAVSSLTFYAGFESRYRCGDSTPTP